MMLNYLTEYKQYSKPSANNSQGFLHSQHVLTFEKTRFRIAPRKKDTGKSVPNFSKAVCILFWVGRTIGATYLEVSRARNQLQTTYIMPEADSTYSLVAKKLIPLYEFLYEFLLGGV